MPKIIDAQPLPGPDSEELRFLPEGPIPLRENVFSWVGIQHGAESKVGSLNIFDLKTKANRSFDLPGPPRVRVSV